MSDRSTPPGSCIIRALAFALMFYAALAVCLLTWWLT